MLEVFLEMPGDLKEKFIVKNGIFPQSHMCDSEASVARYLVLPDIQMGQLR